MMLAKAATHFVEGHAAACGYDCKVVWISLRSGGDRDEGGNFRTCAVVVKIDRAEGKVQSQKLERVHSSCLRSILGVRLSDRHTNEHIRESCGVATLSAYITANRLRWLGHVGRMEEGRLPHIALFSSLHGDMTRPVGRPRHTWEKCVCADLKVLGQSR